MTTIIPTPAPVPDPLSSDFGTKAYDFTVWMAEAAPAMTAVAQETNDALNQSLLGTTSTSTSSITIAGSGTVNFTTGANKGYAIGMTLRLPSTANPANYIKVRLTAYNITTGVSAGTIIGSGGSGTYTSWSVFFDTADPSILTVPTSETVAAGNLIAMNDAGLSMSVAPISPSVLQAVTATSLHACYLANGNTAVFWSEGVNLKVMIVGRDGGTIVAASAVGTAASGTPIWSCELTNGNIAMCFVNASNQAVFKIISTAFSTVVAETVIDATALVASSQVKCCALSGGGFAVGYSASGGSPRIKIYSNAGAQVGSTISIGVSGETKIAICPTAAGGFTVLSGTSSLTGGIYSATGTLVATCALAASSSSTDVNIASKSGSIAATSYRTDVGFSGPELSSASDVVNFNFNGPSNTGNCGFVPPFNDFASKNSQLGHGHIAVLGNGNYIATFAAKSGSLEYPRFVIFDERGLVISSGISSINSNGGSTPVFVVPKDHNGFSLIWLHGGTGNLMFAEIKSGKLLGISLGQIGTVTQYKTSGEVNLGSYNMLNVGESAVSYQRRGARVVI